jgi:tetratricopeptide (TPR) repeat protein
VWLVTMKIFVSYRRADSGHAAGRLGERLDERFTLFMDVDRIRPGSDFTTAVREAVNQADVLVAVIGSQWLTLRAESGGRRIDQPDDWVAEEVGTALRRGIPVIPVLVDGASMPARDELPSALADLANRQAMKIAHESFAADSTRLIETVEEIARAAEPEHVNLWEDPDYPRARGAFLQGIWPTAIEGFERVLRRHPRQPRVVEQLEQARRNQRLLDLHATAEGAVRAGRWEEAVDAFTAIAALQPSDEVKARIADAQLRLRVTELQNDVRALAESGAWAAVLAANTELAGLEPKAGDPDGLATRARAELLEAELDRLYSQGVKQLDEQNWIGAEATFGALLDRRAGYRDAHELRALAQRKGRPRERGQPPPVQQVASPAAWGWYSPGTPSVPGQPRAPSPPDPESSSYRSAKYQAVPPRQPAQDPGRTLGIVGLLLAILCSLMGLASIFASLPGFSIVFLSSPIGLIISIVAGRRSAHAGFKNNIALAGIIICAIWLVLIIVFVASAIIDSSVG